VELAFSLLTLFPGRVGGSESYVLGLLGEFSAGNGPEHVSVLANAPVMEAYRNRVGGPVELRHIRGYRAGDGEVTRLRSRIAGSRETCHRTSMCSTTR
jgi:hypothetical protein